MARTKKPKYYIRADGLHEAIRVIGGKRVAFRGKTDQEVDNKIEAYKLRLANGRTWNEVAEEWEREHFPTIAQGTQDCYSGAIKRAADEFGKTLIRLLVPLDFCRVLEDMRRQGFSAQTVTIQKSYMMQVCAYAVRHEELEINPMREVKLPKGLKKGKRREASELAESAAKAAPQEPFDLFPMLLYYSGLRRGEALALTKADIDFRCDTIRVNKKIIFRNGKPVLEDHTKTETGMRTAPLLLPLREALKDCPDGPLFPGSAAGGYMLHKEFDAAWLAWCRRHGLTERVERSTGKKKDGLLVTRYIDKPTVTPHQFRHSFATLCFDAEIDSKDTAQMMGHSKEEITRGIYTHIKQQRRISSAAKLNQFVATQQTG